MQSTSSGDAEAQILSVGDVVYIGVDGFCYASGVGARFKDQHLRQSIESAAAAAADDVMAAYKENEERLRQKEKKKRKESKKESTKKSKKEVRRQRKKKATIMQILFASHFLTFWPNAIYVD